MTRYVAPPNIRRHAVAQLSSGLELTSKIVFPSHQHTRLQISITSPNYPPQAFVAASDSQQVLHEDIPLDDVLKGVQTEVVDQEIFSNLVNDAGNLSTAHGTVSERLISIEVARGVGLTFELVSVISSFFATRIHLFFDTRWTLQLSNTKTTLTKAPSAGLFIMLCAFFYFDDTPKQTRRVPAIVHTKREHALQYCSRSLTFSNIANFARMSTYSCKALPEP